MRTVFRKGQTRARQQLVSKEGPSRRQTPLKDVYSECTGAKGQRRNQKALRPVQPDSVPTRSRRRRTQAVGLGRFSGDQALFLLPASGSSAVTQGDAQASGPRSRPCLIQVTRQVGPPRPLLGLCGRSGRRERRQITASLGNQRGRGGGRDSFGVAPGTRPLSSSAETLHTSTRPAFWFLQCSYAC